MLCQLPHSIAVPAFGSFCAVLCLGGDWSRFNAVYAVHRTSLALVYGRNRSLYDIKDLYRPVVQHGLLPIAFIQASNLITVFALHASIGQSAVHGCRKAILMPWCGCERSWQCLAPCLLCTHICLHQSMASRRLAGSCNGPLLVCAFGAVFGVHLPRNSRPLDLPYYCSHVQPRRNLWAGLENTSTA